MPSLTSIVIATDFSNSANVAAERALKLPLKPGAKLTLLHVIPDDIPGALAKQALREAERSVEKQAAQVRQSALAKGLTSLVIVGAVVEGEAAAQIAKRANTVEADVIVIGRHGRRPIVDLFMGSTAQKVTRLSERPVLLVQVPAAWPYHQPLVAVDLEKRSFGVIRCALEVTEPETEVKLFHTTSVPHEDFVMMAEGDRIKLRMKHLKEASLALKATAKRIAPKRKIGALVRAGDARTLILQEARAADLLVLGTHGKKGAERFFVGSVSEWVSSHAQCDVLIVRT